MTFLFVSVLIGSVFLTGVTIARLILLVRGVPSSECKKRGLWLMATGIFWGGFFLSIVLFSTQKDFGSEEPLPIPVWPFVSAFISGAFATIAGVVFFFVGVNASVNE